jgi:hypothetical protein
MSVAKASATVSVTVFTTSKLVVMAPLPTRSQRAATGRRSRTSLAASAGPIMTTSSSALADGAEAAARGGSTRARLGAGAGAAAPARADDGAAAPADDEAAPEEKEGAGLFADNAGGCAILAVDPDEAACRRAACPPAMDSSPEPPAAEVTVPAPAPAEAAPAAVPPPRLNAAGPEAAAAADFDGSLACISSRSALSLALSRDRLVACLRAAVSLSLLAAAVAVVAAAAAEELEEEEEADEGRDAAAWDG